MTKSDVNEKIGLTFEGKKKNTITSKNRLTFYDWFFMDSDPSCLIKEKKNSKSVGKIDGQ